MTAASDEAEKLVDWIKQATLFSSLITLALETAVTGEALDLLALIPLAAVLSGELLIRHRLSRDCKTFLNGDLKPMAKELKVPEPAAEAPGPSPMLDSQVEQKLQDAMLDLDTLRPYAQDIALHPYLDQVLQGVGIAEVVTRFKTIHALRSEVTVQGGKQSHMTQPPPKLEPPSKQYLARVKMEMAI